jgi:hypothetical protein
VSGVFAECNVDFEQGKNASSNSGVFANCGKRTIRECVHQTSVSALSKPVSRTVGTSSGSGDRAAWRSRTPHR